MEEKVKEKEKQESKWEEGNLIRFLSTDIPGNRSIYAGLTRIKGISWNFSNAICNILGIDKNKKISELSEEEKEKIIQFIKNPKLPSFVLNRRKDFDSNQDKHIIGVDLDLQKQFDIKRLKKIKSYRGLRHMLGLPVRGQRTKSHFRRGKALGVKKGKMKKSGK
jgi:small subunit ribosomal protein S13